MKKNVYLTMSIIILLVFGICGLSFAQVPPPPAFPFCTDTPKHCQTKVAQVPIPWQFWGIETDPMTGLTNVIDRIRISPTWLNPPPGQPPGQGPVFVRRWVATAPEPMPLPELVWDFDRNMPPPLPQMPDLNGGWQIVDPQPVEVMVGEDLELNIPVNEMEGAVFVAYEVVAEGMNNLINGPEVVGHFINEAVLERASPATIVRIMVNFDIHNGTGIDVTNFELDFHGLDFQCEDVENALGFVVSDGSIWGANEENPLVVRPIPGGTEVKWIQPNRPLATCEWLHVGLVFDCTNFDCFNNPADPALQATVQGYWTTIEPKICEPKTQGFWRRICNGVIGDQQLHPATPVDFDPSMCEYLLIKGKDRRDPCVRAKAQLAALRYNLMHGYLSDCCEFVDAEGNVMTAPEAMMKVADLIAAGQCKEAADLADTANNQCNYLDP
jgi:hypothetical protein